MLSVLCNIFNNFLYNLAARHYYSIIQTTSSNVLYLQVSSCPLFLDCLQLALEYIMEPTLLEMIFRSIENQKLFPLSIPVSFLAGQEHSFLLLDTKGWETDILRHLQQGFTIAWVQKPRKISGDSVLSEKSFKLHNHHISIYISLQSSDHGDLCFVV